MKNITETKCPVCKDIFYTEIKEEKHYPKDSLLCMNCWTVFNKEGKIIERG
jgi:hypothetical protein